MNDGVNFILYLHCQQITTIFVKMKVILPEQALVEFTRACSPLASLLDIQKTLIPANLFLNIIGLLDFVSSFRNSWVSGQDPHDNNFQVRVFIPQPSTT